MSFVGPEIPAHLRNSQRDAGNSDEETNNVAGPQVPAHLQQSKVNIYEDEDDEDDGPKPLITVGPSIPPGHLKVSNKASQDAEDRDEDVGPVLPPHLRSAPSRPVAGPSMPQPGPSSSSSKRQVGPAFPSYAPTYDPNTYDEDDDDDDYGPKPLPAGMQHQEADPVKEFMEREENRRKLAEDAAKPKKAQRDEWMLVPPSSSSLLGNLDPTKLKARQFTRGSGPVAAKVDNSLWTETPAERQQRLADEVSGKKRRVTDAPVEEDNTGAKKRRRQHEEKIKRGVDEYTQKRRGPALVDQHSTTKQPEEKDPAIWDHSRDMGLGGRLMDDDKRNKMLKEAKGLGDRFGSGKSGGFL
ncbi:hypothetical protein B0H34DRAFT_644736 [Crassisporium funariophilum]|nr:hypothetical protein B0H34DRAFT_644736 [Crassisporium funariophilum]